jgi:nucleotide-binding universal stress UspA family protein
MRILLALDFSKGSQLALDAAAARPWPAGTEFLALNVLDIRGFARLPAVIEDAKRQAACLVKEAAASLIRAGHKCASEVTVGAPHNAITEFANHWKADFVMLGSHGHGTIARFLLGSVAQRVLRTAPCSVEVVRPTAFGSPVFLHALKILLPTDGSEFSITAAKSVASRPWPTGSQIKIVSVAEIPVLENQTTAFPLAAVYPASLLEELLESARNHAKEAVENARKIFMDTDLEVVGSSTPLGDPRNAILDQAQDWQADLIVLGSHGRHGLDRMLMGSVSETVAIHAHCSVEVIRPGDQHAAEKHQ